MSLTREKQRLPIIGLGKNAFGEALGHEAAVALLGHFEGEFVAFRESER